MEAITTYPFLQTSLYYIFLLPPSPKWLQGIIMFGNRSILCSGWWILILVIMITIADLIKYDAMIWHTSACMVILVTGFLSGLNIEDSVLLKFNRNDVNPSRIVPSWFFPHDFVPNNKPSLCIKSSGNKPARCHHHSCWSPVRPFQFNMCWKRPNSVYL